MNSQNHLSQPPSPEGENRESEGASLIDRRTLFGVAAAFGLAARNLFANESSELAHTRMEILNRLEKHNAENIFKDPERWYAQNRTQLVAPAGVKRVTHCIDGGFRIHEAIPLLIEQGNLPPKRLEELKRALITGEVPPWLDDYSIPGPGSEYAPNRATAARMPDGHCCGIAGHCSCGACGNNDALAATSAERLAKEMGVPYLGILKTEKLDRRDPIHPELAATLRYDPQALNPSRITGTPDNHNGFVSAFDVSSWGMTPAARTRSYKLITKIAQRDHSAAPVLQQGLKFAGITKTDFEAHVIIPEKADKGRINAELDEGFDGLKVRPIWVNVQKS